MSLFKSWEITRKHLLRAAEFFEREKLTSEELLFLESFKEFVEYNELGLAFDDLESLAETALCPKDFWQEMLLAAEQMNLPEAMQRCRGHLQND